MPAERGAGNSRGAGSDQGHDDRRQERRSDGPDPSRGPTPGGPQTEVARSKSIQYILIMNWIINGA
ncbi:MAG: hypothetical protein RLZZ117_2752 [Cyanobacteriota bacterium]|jgi:hypothetical protein